MEQKITVTGKSVIQAAPDAVRIHLSVSGREETYAAAAESLKKRTQALFESVQTAGIEPGALKTTDYSIQPNREGYSDRDGIWHTRVNGFLFSHDLTLTLPREDMRLNDLMQAFAGTGADTVFSLEFVLQDDSAIRDELLRMAVREAAHQAQILCEAAGVDRGKILEIRHAEESDVYITDSIRLEKTAVAEDSAMEPKEITARDQVTVIFEIREKTK